MDQLEIPIYIDQFILNKNNFKLSDLNLSIITQTVLIIYFILLMIIFKFLIIVGVGI